MHLAIPGGSEDDQFGPWTLGEPLFENYGVVSTLRSGLDELRGEDLRHLSDSELEDRLQEIRRGSGVLEAEGARTVAEIERRGSFADSGHLSITSFVEHRLESSWSEAAKQVRTARALERMPAVREALYEGDVSPSAVGQLVDGPRGQPRGVLEGRGDAS
jgi:Domain of unknown function (DUF222)